MSPNDNGTLMRIVRRPQSNLREQLQTGMLNTETGLQGDIWLHKPSSAMPNGEPHPLKQITIMNVHAADTMAGDSDSWIWAGDQLYADLNLSYDNLPPGTLLAIGEAILQVTEPPHRGCKKFADRFGKDALRWVNSESGIQYNLRGINAVVIRGGQITCGDTIRKIPEHSF